MSTWIVTKAHVDALVQQLGIEKLIEPADADKVGRQIWRENVEAFRYAYDGRHREDIPRGYTKYTFTPSERPLNPTAVHTLGRCWQYQCSEENGYDEKPAYKLVEELVMRLAGRIDTEAPTFSWWGISSIEEAWDVTPEREAVVS